MEPPTKCPSEIKSIMLECWQYESDKRHSFAALAAKLEDAHKKLPLNRQTFM